MPATILDGRLVREEVLTDLQHRVAHLKSQGIYPGLATVLVGSDPASLIYVKGKHADAEAIGIKSWRVDLPEQADEATVLSAISQLNNDPTCTGYIVQLPLPKHLSENNILKAIDPRKDVDGLHPYNLGNLVLDNPHNILPCTPRAIIYLLQRYQIKTQGKRVVIIGRGVTVGRPLSILLSNKVLNATVTLCHSGTTDLGEITSQADIIIAAAGVPGLLTKSMVKAGATVIDVGISRVAGKIQGDVAAEVREVASYISPNPGGVGPLTRAFLLMNLLEVAANQKES